MQGWPVWDCRAQVSQGQPNRTCLPGGDAASKQGKEHCLELGTVGERTDSTWRGG